MKILRVLAAAGLAVTAIPSSANAQQLDDICAPASASLRDFRDAPDGTPAAEDTGVLHIISGGPRGTYISVADDLSRILSTGPGAERPLRIVPVVGRGSALNLIDLTRMPNRELALAQADAREYLEQSDISIIDGYYIARLYDEQLHLLARREFNSIADLNRSDVDINIGGSLSGTGITAAAVLDALGVTDATRTRYSNTDALDRLLRPNGGVDAMFYVAGQPVELFNNANENYANVHFIEIDHAEVEAAIGPGVYNPARLRRGSYEQIIRDRREVETIGVPALLIAADFSTSSADYQNVVAFIDSFYAHVRENCFSPRQNGAIHRAWRDLLIRDEEGGIGGWRLHPHMRELLDADAADGEH